MHTEKKQFLLKSMKFKEVSPGKGVLEYSLIDEMGNPRTVSASAKLNWRKQLSSIKPFFHRELPLIEALANASIDDTIEINFTDFNKKFKRGSTRQQQPSMPKLKVSNKTNAFDMVSVVGAGRFMQLFGYSLAGFVVLMLFFQFR